jgi:hypothetical protein
VLPNGISRIRFLERRHGLSVTEGSDLRASVSRLSRITIAGLGITVAASLAACSSSSSPSPSGSPASSSANANSQATISTSPGKPWTRVWTDSFSGPAGTGPGNAWMYNQGHGAIFGTGEIETMTGSPANTHLSGNGQLVITPIRAGSAWTSGRIQTKSSAFAAPAGGEMMITSTLKQPPAADPTGYWTGFWIIGKGQWPEHGEIDILEDVNSGSMVSGSLHCGNLDTPNSDGTKGPCHETNGLGSGQRQCANCQSTYHTYSVIVDRRTSNEQIRWYLDGREYYSISESRVGQAAWTEGVDGGFSIIFDVAIGGGYPNIACKCQTPAASTTSGASLNVKDVAVYTLKPTSS